MERFRRKYETLGFLKKREKYEDVLYAALQQSQNMKYLKIFFK